jgi:23S rRNA (adenine2503-C2)-methyltransferase
MKPSFFSFGRTGLTDFLAGMGEPRFRAVQLMRWVYSRGVCDPAEMTDLAKELRVRLAEGLDFSPPGLDTLQVSKDGTRKYLFRLSDREQIESVMIPDADRKTLCVSSQVGCAMGCRFCFTARGGLTRNMTPGEIAWQFSMVERDMGGERALTNVVFMGMGEPLQNLDNLVEAIEILTAEWGFGLSPKRITVSTVGIVPNIAPMLARTKVHLAVSLHAPTSEQRLPIVPMEKKYPLAELMATCRALDLPRRQRVTFEYVLLRGVNDRESDAAALVKLLQGMPAKINLIPFNSFPGAPYEEPLKEDVIAFQERLVRAGYGAFIRKRRGEDILAACGQLRGEVKEARMPRWARDELGLTEPPHP